MGTFVIYWHSQWIGGFFYDSINVSSLLLTLVAGYLMRPLNFQEWTQTAPPELDFWQNLSPTFQIHVFLGWIFRGYVPLFAPHLGVFRALFALISHRGDKGEDWTAKAQRTLRGCLFPGRDGRPEKNALEGKCRISGIRNEYICG